MEMWKFWGEKKDPLWGIVSIPTKERIQNNFFEVRYLIYTALSLRLKFTCGTQELLQTSQLLGINN